MASPISKTGIFFFLRGIAGDVVAGRSEIPEEAFVLVKQLELEPSLVGVAQVPRHVEPAAGLEGSPHVA